MERLIDCLVEPPVLSFPDFSQPFTLHTDASNQGLGAVLYQLQNGKLRVIAYTVKKIPLNNSKLLAAIDASNLLLFYSILTVI